MARGLVSTIALLLVLASTGIVVCEHLRSTPLRGPAGGADPGGPVPGSPAVRVEWSFETDPIADSTAVVAGQVLDRLAWQPDDPAFPGDPAGSLRALYDSSLPAGWFGLPLEATLTDRDTFTAAAAFVIDSEGFAADPDGFFQISWGLWNVGTTGLNRTGSLTSFAADTFELIEFDYFPNVSPFFGGPFLAPAVFGAPVGSDAFGNFTSLFDLEVELPLDIPLLAVLEHRPDADAVVAQVYRIVDARTVVPVNGAVGSAPLDFLTERDYEVNVIGLTLWNDGFGGPTPALQASVDFHKLSAISGLPDRPEQMLDFEGDDDSDDDEDSDDDSSDEDSDDGDSDDDD
jgi:hypothetical protein